MNKMAKSVVSIGMALTVMMGSIFSSYSEVSAQTTDQTAVDAKHYFYNQLTDDEKDIYNRLKAATWDDPEVVVMSKELYESLTVDEIKNSVIRAYEALMTDEPIYRGYWKRFPDVLNYDGQKAFMVLEREDYFTEYDIAKTEAEIRRIANMVGTDGDNYTKLRRLWNYMAYNVSYDPFYPDETDKESTYDDTLLGCLLAKATVCAGYADACKAICDELDIPCIIVENDLHAWNYVQMDDGQWYSIDFCADTDSEEWFLLGSQSKNYADIPNYFYGEQYICFEGDFEFPTLSEEQYQYQGTCTDFSYTETESDFQECEPTFLYEADEASGTCTITGYQGKQEGDFVIPAELDGFTVTAIGDDAFYACRGFSGELVLPDTIKYIGTGAFQACSGLSGTLELPDSVEEIGIYAFRGCGYEEIQLSCLSTNTVILELAQDEGWTIELEHAYQEDGVLEDGAVKWICAQCGDEYIGETLDNTAGDEKIDSSGNDAGDVEDDDPAEDTEEKCLGDVDGDGIIGTKDVILAKRYLVGWTSDIDMSAADVDLDGAVNLKDIALMSRFAAGWDVTFGRE